MKLHLHKFLANTKQKLIAVALTLYSVNAYSQASYTLNYTGNIQTVTLTAGTYSIEMWGANGGNSSNSRAGIGGYSKGTLNLTSTTIIYIGVGGTPAYTGSSGLQPGGYNGGGSGYANATGRAGGGATHIATLTGTLGALSTNTSAVIMVAGGGGGDQNSGTIGHGGGLSGGGTYPGTQTSSGGGINGAFGQGGDITTSYGGGGGGGWYGGGGNQNNAGSGGSGYIGGVTSATTIMTGNAGFVSNPATSGDGRVIINELCSITLSGTGLGANNSICSGSTVTLTTNAVSNYSWSNGATTQSIVVTPSSSGVYSVVGTSSAACNSSASLSITVNGAVPSLSIANSATSSICTGKTATLTASGALAYSWAGGATTVTNGVGFFPSATTIYTVTGTNGCGQSSATATITIAPLIVNATTSSSLVCQGGTVVLTATSSVNGYTWYPNGATSNPLTTAPQGNTIYTVTASDGTCIGTATVAVNTNPVPVISVAASNSLVCEGSVVTLTASGASTYTWVNTTSNAAVVSVTAMAPTNYQVSGSNSFGCSASGGQIVLTNAAPVLTLTSTKMIVCVGGSVNLNASSAAGVTFAWVNGPATPGNLVNPTSPTTYSVVGTGTNGCPSPEYMITINTLSTNLSVSAATTAICEGKSTTLTATGANTYTWTGIPSFQGNALVSPATTTVYTVVANTTITGLSCPSTTNISITVNSNPTITVVATKTVVCRTDANIILTAGGAVTYSWSANTNSASTTASNVSVHPIILNNNIYSVIGMNANGCINSGSVTINVRTCTGIEESKGIGHNVLVYPNPSNGEFNVSSDSEITLKVINELGQEVRTLYLTSENNFKGSVTNLAGGVYFLVGQNTTGKINQKVIVTK